MQLLPCLLVLTLLLSVACADTALFDFEDEAEVSTWTIRAATQDKLVQSSQFATSGATSMLFTTPVWKEGMEQWPAFEGKPPVADWNGFDRLMVDITNPDETRHFLVLYVSDSKVPFRNGLNYRFDLPQRGFKRYFIPLANFPEAVNRGDISILHFFTQRPEADMHLHFDNIRLLKPGETPGEPGPTFVEQLGELFLASLGDFGQVVTDCREALYALAETPELRQAADAELAKLSSPVEAARAALETGGLTMVKLDEFKAQAERALTAPERVVSEFKLRRDFSRLPQGDSPMLVGFASSMEKILPRDMPFDLTVSPAVSIDLARNEKESFQVAVMPRSEALTQVEVSIGDLKSDDGDVFSAANIDCDVVGYVETKKRPPYKVPYVGWWPDPILDFLGPVDIAEGDLQTFWVRLRAPKDQAPGVYKGTMQVSAEGAEPLSFDLSVKVYSFTLPNHTPLPTAITFFERSDQMGGEENWQTMKFKYADFLADYYIDYDSLYRAGPPDYEIVTRLHDQGRLVAFNLGNVFNAGTKEDGFDAAIAQTVERLRPAYDKAKELGLLEYAYIYGFDERPKDQFGLLEQCAQALRKAFPEVLLMTTSYDHSFGLDSEVKTIDAWCPLTPRFVPEIAADARAAGKKVWWYICCGPHNPYANWFVEYAAIESRLLMGAMTAKYRPDGFLYYSLDIWNNNQPIEEGPFTKWNPVSWTVYHGDGSLLCSGPGGKPVPTIRLENYRDGMEDFAYSIILEEIIRQYEAKGDALTNREKGWLVKAREALPIPESLVEDLAKYSRDPGEVRAYRTRVGELIDASGMPDADPWGPDFAARGFKTN